ncbi:MAG: sulfite exporter TauE/SafE family protein, partial [Phycisphaerae bacterium]|nr:sulfite exporter TauE/SafE family protein [Phycisphaerae bacterium]
MSNLQTLFDLDFNAYLQGPTLLLALAAFGLAVGILTGLFGVGGGFMVVPLLNVLFGIDYSLAVGSSLSFIIGTSASGASRHMRLRNFAPRATLILAIASMLGAVLGATLNKFFKEILGEHNYTLMMHGLFVIVLLATAWLMFRRPAGRHGAKSLLQRLRLPPRVDLPAA